MRAKLIDQAGLAIAIAESEELLAKDLHASPSDVELLFTSYFAVTGVSMLVAGFVSSRIGTKRTLLSGLVFNSLKTN